MVEILLKSGATPSDHYYLLHYTVLRKHLGITKLLLGTETNPNLRDGNGETPLLIAASTHDIHTTKLLLENGAKPDYPNHFTRITPLHLLVSSNSTREDYSETFKAFDNLLIKYEVDLDVGCPVVGTALTKSMLLGKYKSAQYLTQMGADIIKLPEGVLPLFTNLKIALRSTRFLLVKLMVAAGYNVSKGTVTYSCHRIRNILTRTAHMDGYWIKSSLLSLLV